MAKLDPAALIASLGILAALAIGIVAFVKALSKLQSFNTDVKGIGVGILALSAGIWVMVMALIWHCCLCYIVCNHVLI